MKPKRRITKFDMQSDSAAVALVSKNVGGGANGYKTLLMKSTDVVVELSMAEYLSKFFDIWSYDAKIISKLLGYSDDYDLWDEGELESKTTILSKMKESEEYEEEDVISVAPLMKSLAKASNFKISDIDSILKKANGEAPVSEQQEEVEKASNTSPNDEVTMTDTNVEMIEKSALEAEIAKAVAAKEAELVEIQKGLQAELAEFKKAKEDSEKAKYVELAKGYSIAGVVEDKVEPFAVALQKASADDDLAILVEALGTMVTLTKSLESVQETGHSVDLEPTGNDVASILKANQAKKAKK